MKILVPLSFILFLRPLQLLTQEIPINKTKRTISPQVLLYSEQPPYYSPPVKSVFEPLPEAAKQVAHQQVVYEFQQTPTNAVSNVHVNQFYKPQENANYNHENQPPIITGSESVALPVQHSSIVRHGQNYAQVQQTFPQQHYQTHQYVPGRYLYVNGKVVYQPNLQQAATPGAKPLNYLGFNPPMLMQRLTPPPVGNYRKFSPPAPAQIQQITKPLVAEVNEEQNEEEENEERPVEEEDDEEGNYEEEEDEDDNRGKYFNRYAFDDDDEEAAVEEDEEDDNDKGYTRQVPKKYKKKRDKYDDKDNFKYSQKYSSSTKYGKSKKKKNGKPPKTTQYKSMKYMREGRPRMERIEGRQSENIPVVHKQKIFKEKWYVTKSLANDSS